MPSRTLNWAMDLRARRIDGFWPAIVASCSAAASRTLESCFASPTPMLSVIFWSLGACMRLEYPKRSISAGRICSRYCVLRRAVWVAASMVLCLVQLRPRRLGHAVAVATLAGDTDARALLRLGIDDLDVADVDGALTLDHAGLDLGRVRQGALVALDDVDAFDVDPVLLGVHAQHLARLAAVLAADDDDLIVGTDLQGHGSEHLRRERDDLHVVAIAQLTGHRPEDARAARVARGIDDHGRVLVEGDVGAVVAPELLLGAHDDGLDDLALLDRALRAGGLDGGGDHVADVGVAAAGAALHADDEDLAGARVVGDLEA